MNKNLFALLFITPLLILGFYNTSYSKKDHAPAKNTGALGEPSCGFSGTATNTCHGSNMCAGNNSVLSSLNFDILLKANGIELNSSFKYSPGMTYEMVFEILNPTDRGGFSLTAIDENNNYAGILTATGSESELSDSSSNYIGHTNTLGVNLWTFNWKAPNSGSGDVTFYASANKGSNDMPLTNPCKDTIIPYKMKIIEGQSTAIESISLHNEISLRNNPILNNIIALKIFVKKPKSYFVTLIDLSGKKIYSQKNILHSGLKNIELPLNKKGIFFVNITTSDIQEYASFKILN